MMGRLARGGRLGTYLGADRSFLQGNVAADAGMDVVVARPMTSLLSLLGTCSAAGVPADLLGDRTGSDCAARDAGHTSSCTGRAERGSMLLRFARGLLPFLVLCNEFQLRASMLEVHVCSRAG